MASITWKTSLPRSVSTWGLPGKKICLRDLLISKYTGERKVKTHTIEWTNINSRSDTRKYDPARKLNRILCLSANMFLALVPALAVITGAAWLITAPDLVAYLQVSLWGAGFV